MTEYPKYYKNALTVLNRDAKLCIATFWTKQELVLSKLSEEAKQKVLLVGNLYTREGIKFIIKNTLLCPQIEQIVLTGNDRNGVEPYVRQLNNFDIKDLDGNDVEQLFVNYFGPRIVTLKLDELNDYVLNYTPTNQNWIPNPIPTLDIEAKVDTIDSEYTGFALRDTSLERLWKRILTKIKLYGYVKESSSDSSQKELLTVVSVLMSKAKVFDGMPNKEILDTYIPQVVDEQPTEGLAYTYGSRLHRAKQIENLVNELKRSQFSRRAVAVTWIAEHDSTNVNPPCLVLCDFKIQRNQLYMTCYFRSHDAYNAYCMNIYALQLLQQKVCDMINSPGLTIGYLTCVSNSCHVYSKDFDKLNKIHELDCILDERGYFTISLDRENKNICVGYHNKFNKLIDSTENSSVHQLLDWCQPYISEISHALYMGRELQRAKEALKANKEYKQS